MIVTRLPDLIKDKIHGPLYQKPVVLCPRSSPTRLRNEFNPSMIRDLFF